MHKIVDNKGQVALIIIVAVVLISGVVSVVVFRDKIGIGSSGGFDEAGDINRKLKDCFEQRAVDAVRLVGLQGGYVDLPADFVSTEISNIAYGMKNGKNTLNSLTRIEKEIENYLQITLNGCIKTNDFNNLQINYNAESVKVEINSDTIKLRSIVPISVSKNEKSFTLRGENEIIINNNLGNIHNVANEIIKKHVLDKELIDLTYLNNLEYSVEFVNNENGNIIYLIKDIEKEIQDVARELGQNQLADAYDSYSQKREKAREV